MSGEWRDVPGYEGHYLVSPAGQVYSLKRHKLLALVRTTRGYYSVNLYRDGRPQNFLVHRLVVSAFRGPIPAGLVVNHKDATKGHNALANLEVVTPQKNREHAARNGLRPFRGEDNVNAKLKEHQVREIRQLRAAGVRVRDLARIFGVSERLVYLVAKRQLWRHVD